MHLPQAGERFGDPVGTDSMAQAKFSSYLHVATGYPGTKRCQSLTRLLIGTTSSAAPAPRVAL
jgi:hypothetical protein